MVETELYKDDAYSDPAAAYATDAEVAIADLLRHRLEELYFSSSTPSLPARVHASESH
jgi:hypothetical protein